MQTTKMLTKVGLFSLLLFIISPYDATAQALQWSHSRKLKGAAVYSRVIGENQQGVYLVRFRNRFLSKNIIIEKYRKELTLKHIQNINIKKDRVIKVGMNKKGIYILRSHYNRQEDINEAVLVMLDWDLNPMDKPIVLAKSALSEYYDRGDFRLLNSENGQYFTLFYTGRTEDNQRVLNFQSYSSDFHLLSEKHMAIPVHWEKFYYEDALLDDEGNAYILTTEYLENKVKHPADVKWVLFTYNKASQSLSDYIVNDTSYYLFQPRLSFNRHLDKLHITALYSYQQPDRMAGIYNFNLYRDQDSVVNTFTHAGNELVTALMGERWAQRGNEISGFNMIKVIPRSDGGVICIAERSSITSEEDIIYISGIPQTSSKNIYNFDDVLITSISPTGTMEWHKIIHKNQSTINDGGYYSSIISCITEKRLYIIFNDKMGSNGDVMQYSFSPNGEMTQEVLLESERYFTSVIPAESKQIAANAVLLPVAKNKRFALLKLTYPH